MEKVSIIVFGIMGENAASVANICFRELEYVSHPHGVCKYKDWEKDIPPRKAETCTLCWANISLGLWVTSREVMWCDVSDVVCRKAHRWLGLALKGKNPVWFIGADTGSFDLPAYERDNQHQDEAEEDPENGRELQEQAPHEADPESEGDVSGLSSGRASWELTRQGGNIKVYLTLWLQLQVASIIMW